MRLEGVLQCGIVGYGHVIERSCYERYSSNESILEFIAGRNASHVSRILDLSFVLWSVLDSFVDFESVHVKVKAANTLKLYLARKNK